MDIIAPIIQQPYNVTPVVPTKGADGVLQHNLLPQQVVQATVISAESNQVVLDFGKYTLAASTQQPLALGQKLKLHVVSTEPQLQFQVVDGKGDPSILRLLHLFDHRSELGSQLSNLLNQRPSAATNTAQQPTANTVQPSVAGVTGSGQNLAPAFEGQGTVISNPATQGSSRVSPPSVASPLVTQTTTQGAQTAQVRSGVTANQAASNAPAGQGGQVPSPAASLPSTAVSSSATASSSQLLPLATEGGLGSIQRQMVEGALLPQQWGQLEQLSSQISSDMNAPNSRLVVNLARMLGLDFEAMLTKNQLDPTQSGLKGILTELKNHTELPDSVRESASQMSQQLEVLQLCRLRLAQEGILFLPLPLEFLEQGYVLFEQQGQGGDGEGEAHGHLVSLNLTLKQLGAMQVNLLFEQDALFVRIKCENTAIAERVESYCADLHESLQPFSVRSIQVTTGAEDPALVLLHRLQPQAEQSAAIFDARV